jgi:hypothetical protein
MKSELRGRLLMEAIHAAAIELAKDAKTARHEPEPAAKPTAEEICALAAREPITSETNTDELWSAAAISPDGKRHWGLGRTPGEAKACAWAYSYWPGATSSVEVEVSPEVPNGWTFELYPPPKPQPQMLAISTRAILERVRLTIANVTLDEIEDIVMNNLPYMGGPRQ